MTESTDEALPYQQADLIGAEDRPGFLFYDKLATVFAGQRSLMGRYHAIEKKNYGLVVDEADLGDLNSRAVQARIHMLFGFLVRELGEAMQELKVSKPWKQTFVPSDFSNFKEEMSDSLHFFVEICITAGISADDLFAGYFKAWEKNRGRQASNY